jgi:hypothetical protein
MRTIAAPSTVTPVEAPVDPMVRGYGAPLTELTIWHSEPLTATGIPLAVSVVWVMTVIAPVSGGPAAPGVTMTTQPTETGGPDTLLTRP